MSLASIMSGLKEMGRKAADSLPVMAKNPKHWLVCDDDHSRGPESRIRQRQTVPHELAQLVPCPHSLGLEISCQWEIGWTLRYLLKTGDFEP